MDINEQSRTILSKSGPWKLYDFGGVRITSKYDFEDTRYKISMFGFGFYINSNQFQSIVNSKGIEGLTDSMEKVSNSMLHLIEDNDGYFLFRRSLQEAQKEDHKIIQSC
jgi:hypothetical protein